MTAMNRGAAGRSEKVVLAVDGGSSKTDVVVLSLTGQLLARRRGEGSNPQIVGLDRSVAVIGELVSEALASTGNRQAERTGFYLSGMDFTAEIEAFYAAVSIHDWARSPAGVPPVVENDLFALLRAGTDSSDAVAVVCGTGINAVGMRSDGATARFPAVGQIAGDWGGGGMLGVQALWHAARSEDGRGPKSLLERTVPQSFGLSSVMEVTEGLHLNRIPARTLAHLTPLLFAAAQSGDKPALEEIQRQAREIVTMATTVLRRLDLQQVAIPIVLGGSVLAADHPLLTEPVRSGLELNAPHALIRLVRDPPVLGAALLVLESAGAEGAALVRAKRQLQADPVQRAPATPVG
nr:BadF/BadG/BcrA/BcrD ATPase family protein [Pseudarthrobacter psychrotolerans]